MTSSSSARWVVIKILLGWGLAWYVLGPDPEVMS